MAGRKRPVIWSPEAQADLSEIWMYYAQAAGRGVADNVVRKIGEVCRLLEEYPHGGRSRDEVRPGLRSVAATPHVVFYRVRSDDMAEVIRVIDGRRDIDDLFAEP
jgi:toxin ParE1/3/4